MILRRSAGTDGSDLSVKPSFGLYSISMSPVDGSSPGKIMSRGNIQSESCLLSRDTRAPPNANRRQLDGSAFLALGRDPVSILVMLK
ncbi:hypothetical protein B7494_g8490 [Chlorociboria aeruginascens]|nr:hypothetical protein B7494_g8490 [Chlorociboria aeruginascens]